MDSVRHTCLKLEVAGDDGPESTDPVFVKGTWFDSRFDLAITDGFDAWTLNATEDEIEERASQWDQPVSEYIELAERHLGFQQPGSVYRFVDAGNGHKRLSWTFEKEGTKLEWRWKCKPSPSSKKTTAGILDFLMDANIRLSDEVVRKTQSFERLKVEAEKCLAQSEKFCNEKTDFEDAIYAKFVQVLNSKKAKLRELRDRDEKTGRSSSKVSREEEEEREEEAESTDKTETYDGESDDFVDSGEVLSGSLQGTSKSVPAKKSRGRKRK